MSELATFIKNPLIDFYLTQLRDKNTKPKEFRRTVSEISKMLAYEVSKNLETKTMSLETPLEKTEGQTIKDNIAVVSIMRAGNGMLDAFLEMLPFASAGHIGIYRDKFIKNTVEYYFRVPKDIDERDILLVDPLLATGDTVIAAINRLKEYNVKNIRFICILCSEQGLEKLKKHHPDVEIYAVNQERSLNDDGYLLPGVGDAGDRLYGTV